MSLLVPINGVNYIIPQTNEVGWGSNLDDFFVAISAGTLQKTGGSFTLSAETDFGSSFGLKSLYYKSRSSNIAATGIVRLNNNSDAVSWRNAANSADLALTVNGSNQLCFNGTPIESNSLTSAHILVGNGSNIATDVAMSGNIAIDNTGATTIQSGVITNSMVNTSAAIAYSKLALTGSIVNADINASAAITYSKLSLTGGIVNADVNAAAAIAYSKLNLATSIVNADVSASAAIAYSKLNLSGSILNADVNASAAIAYSKLNLSASVVNADIASAAAIVRSKLAATETADVTYASGKGIFYTDSGTKTVKVTAPTTLTNTYAVKWPVDQGGSNQYLTNDGSGNLSWTNAAGTGTVNSGTQYQLAYYATTTNAVSGLTLITASRALASDANGLPVAQADGTTATELGYVHGVTSAIQTQLNTKATDSLVVHLAGTETITGAKTFTVQPVVGKYAVSSVTDGNLVLYDTGAVAAGNGGQLNLGGNYSAGSLTQYGRIKASKTNSTDGNLDTQVIIGARSAANGFVDIIKCDGNTNAAQIHGTNTNDNAAAGNVGEYIESIITSPTNVVNSGQYFDATSITLTAGDWDITGTIYYSKSTAVFSSTNLAIGISTTSGNSSTGLQQGVTFLSQSGVIPTTFLVTSMVLPVFRVSISGSTVYYLKGYVDTFTSGPPTQQCRLSARRVR